MITHSGIHIQKRGGAEGTPTAMDIAVHTGRICRFGGAVWYPLLPHLMFVGLMAYQRSRNIANFAWGVLHDAHEAVTSDVPRPFKCACLKQEQEYLDTRILTAFVPSEWHDKIDYDLIHQCDKDACDIEAVYLELPGYSEKELGDKDGYGRHKDMIHADETDLAIFRRVLASPFMGLTIQPDSMGVQLFARLLNEISRNDVRQVEEFIFHMGLR